jgi:hypothetical protein
MKTLLQEAGLEEARVRALPPDPDAKGPALILGTAARGPRIMGIRKQGDKR